MGMVVGRSWTMEVSADRRFWVSRLGLVVETDLEAEMKLVAYLLGFELFGLVVDQVDEC